MRTSLSRFRIRPAARCSRPIGTTIATAALNFRVRDGNGCAHRVIATGLPDADLCRLRSLETGHCLNLCSFRLSSHSYSDPPPSKRRLMKLSPRTISTGRLCASPRLQLLPIDPLTLGGAYFFRMGGLILGKASRLDAFSAYPVQG